jgi:hypothetical protein
MIPMPLIGGGLAAASAIKGAKGQKPADQPRQLSVAVDPSGPID